MRTKKIVLNSTFTRPFYLDEYQPWWCSSRVFVPRSVNISKPVLHFRLVTCLFYQLREGVEPCSGTLSIVEPQNLSPRCNSVIPVFERPSWLPLCAITHFLCYFYAKMKALLQLSYFIRDTATLLKTYTQTIECHFNFMICKGNSHYIQYKATLKIVLFYFFSPRVWSQCT